jgi:hypothetical protein
MGGATLRVSILHVAGCPLVERVRRMVDEVLAATGSRGEVVEIEGPYPSPTLLIEGVDVTGRPGGNGSACRLDLPTREQVVWAILSAREAKRGGGRKAASDGRSAQ